MDVLGQGPHRAQADSVGSYGELNIVLERDACANSEQRIFQVDKLMQKKMPCKYNYIQTRSDGSHCNVQCSRHH